MGLFIGIAGVALAVALSGTGSALGIRHAAESASAAMIQEPKNFGKYLVLTALPGTQGIYGFVIAFLALGALKADMSVAQGLAIFFSAFPVAFVGLTSAIYQGRVVAAGISMVVEHPDQSGKALVLGVFVEFYAILGFVMSIILLNSPVMVEFLKKVLA